MGIFSEIFGVKKKFSDEDADSLLIKKIDNSKESNTKDENADNEVPEGAFINAEGEIEYKVIEREIHPDKIRCPDCGGITIDGLEYCDKCGGELGG